MEQLPYRQTYYHLLLHSHWKTQEEKDVWFHTKHNVLGYHIVGIVCSWNTQYFLESIVSMQYNYTYLWLNFRSFCIFYLHLLILNINPCRTCIWTINILLISHIRWKIDKPFSFYGGIYGHGISIVSKLYL